MALLTIAVGRRMAYHLDGSQVSLWGSGFSLFTATQTQLNYLNDVEHTSSYVSTSSASNTVSISVFFPEKRNVTNYFLVTAISQSYALSLNGIYVSTDTTDGVNGTWTLLTTPSPSGYYSFGNSYTLNLGQTEWFDSDKISGTLTGATGIKGIKFIVSQSTGSSPHYIKCLNLYGYINDPSATQRVAWTDNAGTPLTLDKTYTTKRGNADIIGGQYLKNLHTNATSQIVFSIDGEITTVNNATTISVDGGTTWNALPYTWTTSLASSAISSEIKVKYTVPSSETYGLKYYGITATPTFV